MIYSDIIIDEVFKEYTIKNGGDIQNLSRINIFIGKNNSGKSRFLRRIFSSSEIAFIPIGVRMETIKQLFKQIKADASVAASDLKMKGWKLVPGLQAARELDVDGYWQNSTHLHSMIQVFRQLYQTYTFRQNVSNEVDTTKQYILSDLQKLQDILEPIDRWQSDSKKIYIPILRGLRPLQIDIQNAMTTQSFDGSLDNYVIRTQRDYFKSKSIKDEQIISGLHLYRETRRLLLGNLAARRKVRDFENFISHNFFEGQEFSITPSIDDDVVHVRIGSDEKDEKPIFDLGDGIQAIIILTYPLFFHEGENAVICYEEPETHLHPGLQRLFIETLRLPRFKTFQYFITTHSNHFLDLTADYNGISVYTFSKKESVTEEAFVIENVENSDGNVLQLGCVDRIRI